LISDAGPLGVEFLTLLCTGVRYPAEGKDKGQCDVNLADMVYGA